MKISFFSLMRLVKVGASLCVLGLCVQAQALVITNAVTWSGTVQLTGDVSIATSGKLTVAAGTLVRCQANQDATSSGTDSSRVEIIVDGGDLLVEGTAQSPVTFTSAAAMPAAGNWYGIVVNSGNVTLANFVVEFAVKGMRWKNPDIRFSTISLANGTLQRCSEQGFYLEPGGEDQAAELVLDHFKIRPQ